MLRFLGAKRQLQITLSVRPADKWLVSWALLVPDGWVKVLADAEAAQAIQKLLGSTWPTIQGKYLK